ncbi:hypothetical protein RhoFasGS6_02901 [Rhodococcus fascians]|uniref:hypothetical protein n=1 Tax=Rhodococcoides fascians TaxID=1828 RepID=UPI001427E3BD|nr:hypothetical protein [Rhodococcus fascians]
MQKHGEISRPTGLKSESGNKFDEEPVEIAMAKDIVGKVADIEDEYVLLINRGRAHGVESGMIFSIKDSEGLPVLDPDTQEEIGRRYPENCE